MILFMVNKKEWVFKKAKDDLPAAAVVMVESSKNNVVSDPLNQLKPLTNTLIPKQNL